jgi:hypothetical protein
MGTSSVNTFSLDRRNALLFISACDTSRRGKTSDRAHKNDIKNRRGLFSGAASRSRGCAEPAVQVEIGFERVGRRRAPLGAPPTPISLVVGLPVGKVFMLTSTTCWPAIGQVLPDSRIEGLRFLSWGIESVYCA